MKQLNKKKHINLLLCSALTTVLFLQSSPVFADETKETTFLLDQVVVTATRTKETKTDIPASVTVISQDEIQRGGYKSVLEILQKANLSVYDGGSGGIYSQSSVFINGDDRVLVMVDGRRINGDAIPVGGGNIRANLNHLPSVDNIERIEIVRGSASSLYGSDAAGGVIQIITREAKSAKTTLKTQYGSWGMRDYNLTAENRENGIGYVITAERREQDYFEYKDGKTGEIKRMGNSAGKHNSVSLKVDKELSNNSSISMYAQHVDSKVGYFMMPSGFPWHYPTATETARNDSIDLNYQWKNKSGTDGGLKLYRSNNMIKYQPWYEGFPIEISEYYLMSKTSGFDLQNNWQLSPEDNLVGGIAWNEETVDLPSEGIEDIKNNNKAIFLENRWSFAPDWSLTTGIRRDDHSVYGGKSTARVALNRKIDDNTNVYANWGQFYKVPLIVQLYGKKFTWGNPDLRPEEGESITLGFNTRLNAKTSLQGSVFSSNIDNAIKMVVQGSTPISKNVANQKRRGMDISLNHQLTDNLNISAGYTYSSVKEKGTENVGYYYDTTYNQPNGYRLGIDYKQDKWDGEIVLRGATGRSLEAFTSTSYWVIDATANYQFKDNLKMTFKGYNLNNRSYELRALANYPGGFPLASRHFYLGLEYSL